MSKPTYNNKYIIQDNPVSVINTVIKGGPKLHKGKCKKAKRSKTKKIEYSRYIKHI